MEEGQIKISTEESIANSLSEITDSSIATMERNLEELLVGYSKLIASGRSYSIKDYLDLNIRSYPLKIALMQFGLLIQKPESAILEYGTSNKNYAIKRARNFCDNLIEILEDIERSGQQEFERVRAIKQLLLDFRKTVPEPKRGVTPGQVGSMIAIIAAIIPTVLQLSTPYQIVAQSIIIGFIQLFLLAIGLWIAVWLAFFFKDAIWYKLMVRRLGIRKKELAVLRSLRPLTKGFSKWVYSTDQST